MIPLEDWLAKGDNAAMEALPAHLRLFVTTPEGFYQTATLPVVVGEEQWILSAFCDATSAGYAAVRGIPRVVYAPRVLQWIHYPSGAFRWEEPAPNAHGQPTAVPDEGGLCLGPIQRGHQVGNAWGEARRRYFPLVRRVVEQRWLVTAYPVTAEERDAARALQDCVAAYYDAVLWPFYRHYGRHFLGWMERAAK